MASRGGEQCSSDASLGGGGPGCPKRRKASAGAEALWAVHCPDGAKFSVTVAEGERVAEVKRAIAALRGVPCFAFDLFIGGAADPLCGEQRLGRAGAAAKLFMLSKVVSDRLALAAIFKSTGGEGSWKEKLGWEELQKEGGGGDGTGQLFGVQAAGGAPWGRGDGSRAAKLELAANGLSGSIVGGEIQQLSALTVLNLRSNQLAGPIPAELGQLAPLTWLNLHRNQLTGPIPAGINSTLASLSVILLKGNLLTA